MEDFIDALIKAIKAKARVTAAQNDCGGSWGYYLHDLYEARDDAVEECNKHFNRLMAGK